VDLWNAIVGTEHRIHVLAGQLALMKEKRDYFLVFLQRLHFSDPKVEVGIPYLAVIIAATLEVHQWIEEVIAHLIQTFSIQRALVIVSSTHREGAGIWIFIVNFHTRMVIDETSFRYFPRGEMRHGIGTVDYTINKCLPINFIYEVVVADSRLSEGVE
jgi:hypothetical protein